MKPTVSLQLLQSLGPLLIAAAVALGFLAFRLYRGRGGVLLALRLGAIALVVLLLLEPVLAFFSERSGPPRVAVLIDGSLSMTIPFPSGLQAAAGVAAPGPGEEPLPTRADRLRDFLDTSRLVKRLEARGPVDVYRFGGTVDALDPDAGPLDIEPRDDRTDVARALDEGTGSLRRRTGAIVLLSDGSQNVGVDPRAEARRLGVPVFAVGVGSEGPVTDLSIFEVVASNVAYLDNVVPVVARIRARGDSAGSVPVYLSEGGVVLDSTVVDLPGGGRDVEAKLEYEPTEEGLHRYRVWTPARENEIADENNEHLFAVRVLKEKIKVLLVASRPGFELTFLKRALESDVSLAVETVTLSLAKFPGRLGGEAARLPDEYAELAVYDLVVLLDAGAASVPVPRLDEIARFVTERGGALMVMGPPRAFDLADSELADLLPFVLPVTPRARTGQILPRLTPSGRTHPVTALESDAAVNARLWSELPPLGIASILPQVRPEARVLVEGEVDGVPREDLPLVAAVQHGRGRVLAVAGAPYWRWDLYLWGTGRSGDLFRRFVSRSVRWLVARDELKQVMVRPGKSLYDGAESVVIEGQVYDDDFRPIEGADVRATVRGPMGQEEERPREISLVDLGAGRYRASLPGLPPGDYRIEGNAGLGGAELGGDQSEMTVAPYRMEFEDPAPDFALLREVARESGGRFVLLDEAKDLPDELKLEPVVERSVREWPFQESSLLFLALLALLGFEWALRRGRGLP
jgi:hypothetical protein